MSRAGGNAGRGQRLVDAFVGATQIGRQLVQEGHGRGLTLLAGGALLAPLFARMSATSAATTTAATRKQGHVVVFADSDAGALADRIAALQASVPRVIPLYEAARMQR